jgi:hypothetical protein
MTDQPKEIWLNPCKYPSDIIEEELCRQINKGITRSPEEVRLIKVFIDRSK